jgi:RimJ/RimL family protein N-acetyltransferase
MSQLTKAELHVAHEEGLLDARLRDGTPVSLRPLEHGETEPLLRVFDGMSGESRALRYLTGLPRLPQPMLSMLTAVDDDRHVAWLASVEDEPAGVARYVRASGSARTAEVAFEVVDRHHGRGLGTVLLDTITTVAAARGIRRIQGTLAPSNTASRRLLAKVGATTRWVDGLLEADGPLRLLDPPVVDRSAVLRLVCGASWDAALDIG